MADPNRTDPRGGEQWWRKGKPGRLKSSMVGISAAAVLGVYAAGYVSSGDGAGATVKAASPASAPLATATAIPPATATAAPRGPAGRTLPGGEVPPTVAPTATPVTARTPVAAGTYKDGSYTGTGVGPHGGMTVAVAVEGGRITSVDITACNTRWPCSRISELPSRVLAAQSAQVQYVTRATDSSVAFVRAVSAALEQAR
ncbi:MAG: FMN-binding protein [Dehalococcoidia bacterium]|nr:FMN-binding protein [Dehalococcoidia bacterium]